MSVLLFMAARDREWVAAAVALAAEAQPGIQVRGVVLEAGGGEAGTEQETSEHCGRILREKIRLW